jgi:integrase
MIYYRKTLFGCGPKLTAVQRHTYATLELIENRTDLHTLAKQMGNSVAMIERHYSKLTATMAAERLA